MLSRSSASGGASSGVIGSAEGATGRQPPRSSGISWPPRQGTSLEALRPACASWIPSAIGECLRIAAMTRPSARSFSSEYRPRQPGVMRPIASTAVASTNSIAAPPRAR